MSLESLTLETGLSEALSEEILRSISSSMTSIASDWHDHLHVGFILGKHLFETVG